MGVYTHQLYDNTLYINKIQNTLLFPRHKDCKAKLSNRPFHFIHLHQTIHQFLG